jgi:phosphoglycolate phosphatase-like HAD superfamily hydrolase
MFGPVKNFIFDLDGTLLNTMPLAFDAFIEIFKELNFSVSKEDIIPHLGKSPMEIFLVWVKDKNKIPEIKKRWNEWNLNVEATKVKSFEGVQDLLDYLKENNFPFFIYTGRDRVSAESFLKKKSWCPNYFPTQNIYCGGEEFPDKPSPEPILDILKKFNLNAEETLMVGDHEKDILAGLSAGVKTAAALWDLDSVEGRTQREKYRKAWQYWDQFNPHLRMSSPLNLIAWLKASQLS